MRSPTKARKLGGRLLAVLAMFVLAACATASASSETSPANSNVKLAKKNLTQRHKQTSPPPSYRFQNASLISFPSDDKVAKCASFEKDYFSQALRFQLCPDGKVAEIPFSEAAFKRAEGRDLISAVADWRNAACAKLSKAAVVQTEGFKLESGIMRKSTFAGESAFIRYRAPRSLNAIAFDYRPKMRKSWEGSRYVLLSFTVQTETAKPKAYVELGVDDMGVFYIDVKAAAKEGEGLERLYRFDVPPLSEGEHVLVFGQRQGSGDATVMENFFAIDNVIFFTSRAFFQPDLFSGFTGLLEVPGDPGAVSVLGLLSSDYVCASPKPARPNQQKGTK